MELPEEQNKLKEIAAGNVEAFEHLFFQYQPRLVNFLIGLTHDKEVSRDMAQDLFLSLWKDREKLKNVRSFSSYLFQMARFTVYDYFDRLIVSEKYTNETGVWQSAAMLNRGVSPVKYGLEKIGAM